MSNFNFTSIQDPHPLYFDYSQYNVTTTVEIEGCTYEVLYNQYDNQFEAITIELIKNEYPEEPAEFEGQELYDVIEDILQERFEDEIQ